MSDAAPPGWYPDGSGQQRYWDGSRWLDAPPPGPPPGQPPGPPPGQVPPGAPAYGPGPTDGGPRSWAEAGYAAPPPGGPGPAKRSRTVLWAVLGVVAVVLVAALVTTLVLVTGGDDDEEQAGSAQSGGTSASTEGPEETEPTEEPTEEPQGDPADTVQSFIDAAVAGDCDALEELVTDDFLDVNGDCDPADFSSDELDGVELEVGDSEVDGDTAVVALVTTYQGSTVESDIELVYEDDTWLIDGLDEPEAPSAEAPSSATPS